MSNSPLMPTEEALSVILSNQPEMGSESVPTSAALGRVLAETVTATEDIPKYANSSMDGFAVLETSTRVASAESPVSLRIAGESAAGRPYDAPWDPDTQAVRIMTGAIVPEGANAVVERELVHESGDTIDVTAPVQRGRNIRLIGEDVRRGETVMTKGTVLGPGHLGVLATLGVNDVGVARKPSIAVITTGSELVDPASVPGKGEIRNSSLVMIPSYVEDAGGCVTSAVSVRDDKDELISAIRESWESDAVITTGGISVGAYDFVRPVLEQLDVELKYAGVNMKPGKPFAFGIAPNGTPVFCLPGNPVSSAVAFIRFVRPALDRMMGRERNGDIYCRAVLEEEIIKKDEKTHFLRGVFTMKNDEMMPSVRTTGSQSSGVLSSMSRANCLVILPPEKRTFTKGDIVEIQSL